MAMVDCPEIDLENFIKWFTRIILTSVGRIPQSEAKFDEGLTKALLEQECFEDGIQRTGNVSYSLAKGSELGDNTLTRQMFKEHLTKIELLKYGEAARLILGLKPIILNQNKKVTELIRAKAIIAESNITESKTGTDVESTTTIKDSPKLDNPV